MENAALFECLKCGRLRRWGWDKTVDHYRPLLNCDQCHAQTRHEFVKIKQISSALESIQ